MTPHEFVKKWQPVTLSERSSAQQHFLDLCDLVGHGKPAALDATGESFTFEKGVQKAEGGDGWADVWKNGFFGWEYKGKHKDLEAAYHQLQRYRESLENPPLLVVCDTDRIIVRTNYTNTKTVRYDIRLADFDKPESLRLLRSVFFSPDDLKPGATCESITAEAASQFAEIAQSLRARNVNPAQAARFLDRIVFCLFAEDVQLLPEGLFRQLAEAAKGDPKAFTQMIGQLFSNMASGGYFGVNKIAHFNGNLFTDGMVVPLIDEEIRRVLVAARLDWSAVDPSIFGTLFERGMDPAKRSQLGAHYTSRHDIETLVEPVVMRPLRAEWQQVRTTADNLIKTGKRDPAGKGKALSKKAAFAAARDAVLAFQQRLAAVRVLDPACGSGNFLYIALQKLKDLEKEIYVYANYALDEAIFPAVGPQQLYGIEINPYAFDLAQMTIWIGYLQWIHDNGFGWGNEPYLRLMDNFRHMDAILDRSDPDNPKEPDWPEAEFIIGNPPFLGGKRLRTELGDAYVDNMFTVFEDRVSRESDLVTYWFEMARNQIQKGKAKRAGLIATQAIRAGANRKVLERIKQHGDIFMAWSDREWVLDGADVRVSLIAFDGGHEIERELDGRPVQSIHSNLSSAADITRARRLTTNQERCFMGDTKGGAFDIGDDVALPMLVLPSNPNGRCNSDVIRPWMNASDIVRRRRSMWLIDFGVDMEVRGASFFERPFEHVLRNVRPERAKNNRATYRERWWLHVEPRPALRAACANRSRYIATPRVAKHRIFIWCSSEIIPDSRIYLFALDSDYEFGVLHSRVHEVWSLATSSRHGVGNDPTYNNTTCFETFPFPTPTAEQTAAIAAAAKELDTLRNNWLNPPEWTREEILEFPGSADGPWSRYVHDPDARGIGTVRYPRLVPKDDAFARQLAKRTLTNLYNQRPTWLDLAHRTLDAAVFAAYDLPVGLSDDQILERLLALNFERAAAQR